MPDKFKKAWPLGTIYGANTSSHTYSLPWKFRIDLLEKVAKTLSDLHYKNRAYGFGGLSNLNILLKSVEEYGLKSLDNYPPITSQEGAAGVFDEPKAAPGTPNENLSRIDILCFGVILLECLTEKPIHSKDLPQLCLLLKRRGLSNMTPGKPDLAALNRENDKLKSILSKEQLHRDDREVLNNQPAKPAAKKRRFSISVLSSSGGTNNSKDKPGVVRKMIRRASMVNLFRKSTPNEPDAASNAKDLNSVKLVDISATDEFAVEPLVKKEVRNYMNDNVLHVNLQKPNWLLSLEELCLNLLTTVDESRPSAKAARSWMLEALQSFEKSSLKHQELKKLINDPKFSKMSSEGKQKKIAYSETMRRVGEGNYLDYYYSYEIFYSDKVAQNVMGVLIKIKGIANAKVYNPADVEGDVPDDASVDSFMPPVPMTEALKEADFVSDVEEQEVDDFPKSTKKEKKSKKKKKNKKKDKDDFPATKNEFRLSGGVGVLRDKPPPLNRKLIGKKANKILSNMDKERERIGKILSSKEVVKILDAQEKVPHENVVSLLKKAKNILTEEDNLLVIDAPAIVVGDIHGQYFDLRQVMKFCGKPRKRQSEVFGLTRKRQKKLARQMTNLHTMQSKRKKSQQQRMSNVRSKQLLAQTVRISKGNMLRLQEEISDDESEADFNPELGKQTSHKGKTFLFLGDYVDRGNWSCEVLFYLLSLKVEYPEGVVLLRGNHECDAMADTYGFREECEIKYGREVYHRCLHVFNALPIACLINLPDNRRFLACHGGISDKVGSLEQIAALDRFREPGIEGTLCDILWSDPVPDDVLETHNIDITTSFEEIGFLSNETRGCAKKFGYQALEEFLAANKLIGLIRAHEAKEQGFQFHFQQSGTKDHLCVTVFSAPNYMTEHGNKGAVLIVHDTVKNRLEHQMKRLNFKYSAEEILRQTDKDKDACLDLLEPICYHEVHQPEPAQFDDHSWTLVKQIEEACPYVPTSIEEFYNSALDLLDRYGTAKQQLKTMKEQEEQKAKMAAEDMLQIELLRKQQEKSPKKKKKEQKTQKKFDRTVKKVNEVHPGVMNEKLRAAGSKLDKLSTAPETEDKSMQQFFEEVQGRSFMWRENVEIESRDLWLDFVTEWFSQVADHAIYPDTFFEHIRNCVVLCQVAAMVAENTSAKFTVPEDEPLTFELNAFEVRQNLLVFQDLCKGLGIKHMFFVSDLQNNELNFVLPALIELAVYARTQNMLPTELEEVVPEEVWKKGIGAAAETVEGEWRTKDLQVGNVTFNSQERLMLQLLFLMIDRDDTGFLQAEGVVTWAKEEGKFIRPSHAKKVISAIDYDGDKAVGLRDFFQYASRLKEDYQNDLESLDGYETAPTDEGDEEFEGIPFDNSTDDAVRQQQLQMQTVDLNEVNDDLEQTSDEGSIEEYYDADDR